MNRKEHNKEEKVEAFAKARLIPIVEVLTSGTDITVDRMRDLLEEIVVPEGMKRKDVLGEMRGLAVNLMNNQCMRGVSDEEFRKCQHLHWILGELHRACPEEDPREDPKSRYEILKMEVM